MLALAQSLGADLLARRATLATAESCTGGLAAAAMTAIAGSSQWFDRGFVTYTNQAKIDDLGVDEATLVQYGAVSEPTAREMALGALLASGATHALATTGIAGPGGATSGKPVGMVCFGWAWREADAAHVRSATHYFDGDRTTIRDAAVCAALRGVFDDKPEE
nr:CinA family protein [Pigmentiphaga aceris]